MEKIYNNKKINIDPIGEFKIEELNKEYIVCSIYNNKNDDNQLVSIFEIDRNQSNVIINDIPNDECDLVLAYYEDLKKFLLESETNYD